MVGQVRSGQEYSVQFASFLSNKFTVLKVNSHCMVHMIYIYIYIYMLTTNIFIVDIRTGQHVVDIVASILHQVNHTSFSPLLPTKLTSATHYME